MKTLRMVLVVIIVVIFGNVPYQETPAEADEPIPSCGLDAQVIGRVPAIRTPAYSPFPVISQDEYLAFGTVNQVSSVGGGSASIDPLEFGYNMNLFSVSLLEPEQPIHLITLDATSTIYDSRYVGVYSAARHVKPLLAQNGDLMIWITPPHLTVIRMEQGVPVKVEDHHLLSREQTSDVDDDGRIDLRVHGVSSDGAHILWSEWLNDGLQRQLHLYDVAQAVSIPIARIRATADTVGFTQDGRFIFYPQSPEAGGGFYGHSVEPDAESFPLAAELAFNVDVTPLPQSQILFVADEDGHVKLYMADLAAQTRALLHSYAYPDWYSTHIFASQDGEIAVTHDVQDGEVTAYVISLHEGQSRSFALWDVGNIRRRNFGLRISPDKQYMFGGPGLSSLSVDSGQLATLTPTSGNMYGWWPSPDGQYVIYEFSGAFDSADYAFYQVPSNGGAAVEIFAKRENAVYLDAFEYSHDGTYWFFKQGSQTYSAYDVSRQPEELYRWTVGSQNDLCEIARGPGVTFLGIGDDTLIYSAWEDGIATLYSAPIAVE